MRITFIGLGIMGSRMAANLLKGGHRLTVYNRSPEKASELVEQGAICAESPSDAVKEADVLFTMLENPGVVDEMGFGVDGFFGSLKPGSIWIDCSTVDPAFSEQLAVKASENEIRFIDAPVSGSKLPAANGELIFLTGGSPEDIEEVQPLLDLMGKKTIHVGGNGKGSAMKLMINQMLGISMVAFSESLSLGMAMGIEKSKAMDILLDSAVTPPILKAFRSRIEDENYEPNFPLKHLHKDMNLFTATAYSEGKAVPLTSAAKEIYGLAKQKNLGEMDFSSIFRFLED